MGLKTVKENYKIIFKNSYARVSRYKTPDYSISSNSVPYITTDASSIKPIPILDLREKSFSYLKITIYLKETQDTTYQHRKTCFHN